MAKFITRTIETAEITLSAPDGNMFTETITGSGAVSSACKYCKKVHPDCKIVSIIPSERKYKMDEEFFIANAEEVK